MKNHARFVSLVAAAALTVTAAVPATAQPTEYPRDGRAGYFMNPADILAAERSGAEVTAVYHSHVGAGAYLSRMDLEYATRPSFPYPNADQIVLSVFGGSVKEAGLFRRSSDTYGGYPVEADHP